MSKEINEFFLFHLQHLPYRTSLVGSLEMLKESEKISFEPTMEEQK